MSTKNRTVKAICISIANTRTPQALRPYCRQDSPDTIARATSSAPHTFFIKDA